MKAYRNFNDAVTAHKSSQHTRPAIIQGSTSKKTILIPFIKHPNIEIDTWYCVQLSKTTKKYSYSITTRKGTHTEWNKYMYWGLINPTDIDWKRVQITALKAFDSEPLLLLKDTSIDFIQTWIGINTTQKITKKGPAPTKLPTKSMNKNMRNYWDEFDDDFETADFQRLAVAVLHEHGIKCSWCGDTETPVEIWNCNFSTRVRVLHWKAKDCIPVCQTCKKIVQKVIRTIPLQFLVMSLIKVGLKKYYIIDNTRLVIYENTKIIQYDRKDHINIFPLIDHLLSINKLNNHHERIKNCQEAQGINTKRTSHIS